MFRAGVRWPDRVRSGGVRTVGDDREDSDDDEDDDALDEDVEEKQESASLCQGS